MSRLLIFLSRMKKPYMQQIRLFTTNSDFISKMTIPRTEFVERRSKLHSILLQSIPAKCEGTVFALLLSRRKTFSAPDVPHIYRQCSYFRYLCGINNPNSRLLIGPENQCVLFTENQNEHQILWEGRAQSSQEIHRVSGIDQVLPMHEFEKYLIETVRDAHLAVDLPTLREAGTNEFDLKKIYQMLCQDGFNHISLNDKIDQLRWIKSKNEQELMKESARIGSETINAMIRESNGFKNESQIVGFLEYQCRLRGANYLAYPPVVASGANANTIHYISSNMKINPGDCVLVDAGCDVDGYVSDITRCFPITGSFTTAQKTLYDVLNHIQDQLLHYVENRKPLRLNELYLFMLECMADALESIIFFKKNLGREELIKECDKLCPHHVSHYLGMDVHDTPSISRAIDCKPGVVITVEPGIYVRKENTAIREEFKGIGFRIEDDVLLNDTNAKILTNQCIRNSGEIEYSMRI